jgi:hypothetical protein
MLVSRVTASGPSSLAFTSTLQNDGAIKVFAEQLWIFEIF